MAERLFRGAPDALVVSAHYETKQGWFLTVGVRFSGETWAEGSRDVYEALSSAELVDVLEAFVIGL